jgi:6-phosphogluconolactonase
VIVSQGSFTLQAVSIRAATVRGRVNTFGGTAGLRCMPRMRFNKAMRNIRHLSIALLALFALLLVTDWAAVQSGQGNYLVYVGTYTRGNSKGIYSFRFNASTGDVSPLGLAAETPSPSFLVAHPNWRFLYAVSEVDNHEGQKSGAVAAFAMDRATGKLTLINQVASRGGGPCYVAVDSSGKNVLVANYGGGSVAALPIREDGGLREASAFIQHTGSGHDPRRQQAPHAHSINLSRDNRFAIAADLGLDQLLVYRFDATKGTLVANDPPFAKLNPGAGPRHFAFHPSGRFGYVINEMQSTVTALSYDPARGSFKDLQTLSTLPKDFTANNSTAEVQVHPTGKFLYGSNRGHDSIAVFAFDRDNGTLVAIEQVSTQGKTPRNFRIDPTGSYLFAANQNTNNIVIFRIDPQTGRLTPTGKVLEAPVPVCIKFVPAN